MMGSVGDRTFLLIPANVLMRLVGQKPSNHGRQDKSADCRRAHVVGGDWDFSHSSAPPCRPSRHKDQ